MHLLFRKKWRRYCIYSRVSMMDDGGMKKLRLNVLGIILVGFFPASASAFEINSWLGLDPKDDVEVTVSYDEECEPDEPLRFRITNRSSKTITYTYFKVTGRWPGRSSSVIYTPPRGYSNDAILEPGYYVTYCMSPLYMLGAYDFMKDRYTTDNVSYPDLKKLEWATEVTEVSIEK